MLYWGQHGVSKDAAGALRWFEKSALQMKDASALYDYSILLMKVPWGIRSCTYIRVELSSGCVVCVLTVIDWLTDADFLRAGEWDGTTPEVFSWWRKPRQWCVHAHVCVCNHFGVYSMCLFFKKTLSVALLQGSINALNGLGWYHGIIRKDHEKAAEYFEQAALNGSSDGMFNLGIYHLSGKNPNSPFRNEVCLPHTSPHIHSVANQLRSMSPYISFMIHRRLRSSSSWTRPGGVTRARRWRWPGTSQRETLKACLGTWRGRSCERLSLTWWRRIHSGLLHCRLRPGGI